MPIVALVAATLLSVYPAFAGSPVRFAGQLCGLVTDSGGFPQVGAVVMLYNRQDRLLQKLYTDLGGNFAFDELLPDVYTVRVTFASFVPAAKEFVQVKPGMRSLLGVSLSKISSSVQVVAVSPALGGLMSDDWKWTLRADAALRPILRMFPVAGVTPNASRRDGTAVFSNSRGMVRISAADGVQSTGPGDADLGTQFAFATSVYGGNHLKVSGNLGYGGSVSGAPAASAFRTTLSRNVAGTAPAVSVTVRQMFVPLHAGQAASADNGLPALRSMAVSFADKASISDSLTLEYGAQMDMVSFVDRLHYFSPFARLNYAVPHGKFDLTYTSGNARPELGVDPSAPNADLQRDLTALAVAPRVSLLDGHARVQRGDNYELGLTQRYGSREFRVSAYNSYVTNATVTIANPQDSPFEGDLLPDLYSNSALFNAGRFRSTGYTTSVTQDLGESYKVTVIYGTVGVLTPDNRSVATAEDLREAMQSGQRAAFTLRGSGTVKKAGTRFMASYQWTDYAAALPGPDFSTESTRPGPGLNVLLRQPLPQVPGMPWHIEASAEFRNMLAQGYLPMALANGRQLLLVNSPRCVRGGLAFVF
jgi:hypothetical protein